MTIDQILDADTNHQYSWLCLAAGLHLVLLIWDPVVFQDAWNTIIAPGENGIVEVVDIPGPPGSGLPSIAIPEKLPHSGEDLGSRIQKHPTPQPPEIGSLPTSTASHLISKPFRIAMTPQLPLENDPEITMGKPSISLAPIKVSPPALPTVGNALIDRRGLAILPKSEEPTGTGANSLVGVGGRVRIEYAGPAEEEVSPLLSPTPANKFSAKTRPLLEGPLANRSLIRQVIPEYPAWAEEQGISGITRLYFTVTREGLVRSSIRVTQTTGHPELDQLAVEALKQWRFSAAPTDTNQWGIVTFTFSLSHE